MIFPPISLPQKTAVAETSEETSLRMRQQDKEAAQQIIKKILAELESSGQVSRIERVR